MKKILIETFLILIISFNLYSQKIDDASSTTSAQGGFDFTVDTLKLKVHKIIINEYGTADTVGIDTVQRHIELYESNEKNHLPYINLGQTGTPSLPMVFKFRKESKDFVFLNPYITYLNDFKKISYYKTNTPYTDFKYMGGVKLKEEQFLDAIHTQSPNRFTNWGIKYTMLSPPDLSSPTNTSLISHLSVWSFKQFKAYSILFYISSFKVKRREFGGVFDEDSNFVPYDNNLIYYLNNTSNVLKYNDLVLSQKYEFNYSYSVNHTFKYQTISKVFRENSPNKSYFGNPLITDELSYDSTGVKNFENTIVLNVHKKMYYSLAYTNSMKLFYYFRGFLYNLRGEFIADNYFTTTIKNSKLNRNYFSFSGQFHFTDRNSGDLYLNLKNNFYIDKNRNNFLQLKFNFASYVPDFFYENYNGNYLKWNNNFEIIKKTSANLSFRSLKYNFSIDANSQLIKNYVYFGYNKLPEQDTNLIEIQSIGVSKSFHLKPFVLDLKAYYQTTNADTVLNLPSLVSFGSLYMDFGVAKNALHINVGADVYYYSQFPTYAYAPSIGMFYLANDRVSGNYPVINFFLSGKIKSAILIFRFDNALGWILAPYNETVEHYHMRNFFFRMGVRWWFKN